MLADYGITPWVINEEFTPEMLHLIVVCRDRRIRAINATIKDVHNQPEATHSRRISSAELLAKMKINPKDRDLKRRVN